MSIFEALVYGIVQGLGEFLPISSTAHLTIVPKVFGWNDPGLAFDVALHIGTLFAVIMFFWKDWIKLIKDGFTNVRSASGKLFWFLAIACIPGGIAGVLFEDKVATSFRSIWAIGVALIVMGIVLYAADKLGKSVTSLEKISFGKSIIIGISQAVAIVPGVSRSGITIASGRVLGLTRDAAARFTFLLSTPFIFGSAVYKLKDIGEVAKSDIGALPFAVAIITSAIVGALSIKFLLGYIKKKGFGIFVGYRFILGAFLIASFAFGWIK